MPVPPKTAGAMITKDSRTYTIRFAANFGDGRINIVAERGRYLDNRITGLVVDESTGKPFTEPGLWGLLPGTA